MRFPLAYTLGNRQSTLDDNGKLVNGYAEVRVKDDKIVLIRAYKRPGTTSSYAMSTGTGSASTTGQGMFVQYGPAIVGVTSSSYMFAVRGDVLWRGF